MTWFWISLTYVVCLVFFGLTALRKGHTALFMIGFFVPVLWIVGAFLHPTNAVATERARAQLR